MKEIVVISGKGGTGKTSVTAALSYLNREKALIVDCDVDASNLHLVFDPEIDDKRDFYSGFKAEIDENRCMNCGKCHNICRFDAIEKKEFVYSVNETSCEGCGYCEKICPANAITMKQPLVGKIFIGTAKHNIPMIYAKLDIGADNSGKLVSEIKKLAREKRALLKKELLIVDGSPGIGCPVVASLSGADRVIIVTEPTVSGIHDLERVFLLTKRFKIKAACIINKADLNKAKTEEIKTFLNSHEIKFAGEIPYSKVFTSAVKEGKNVIEYDPESDVSEILRNIWSNMETFINEEKQ